VRQPVNKLSAGALLIGLIASTPCARAFVNDRFGVSVDVPADWRAEPPPGNDDGCTFDSPDGAARILVYGGLLLEGSATQAMDEKARAREGERVTYLRRGSRSVTVSGFAGSTVFYRRSLLTCGDKVWNTVEIAYPASEKRRYDGLVARLAASLRGGSPAGMSCP
jgi:hypothetical protein